MNPHEAVKTATLLFQDERAMLFAPAKGSVEGHLVVAPVRAVQTVDALTNEEMGHLLQIASIASTVVFEKLGAQGTNIILIEERSCLHIDILARKADDGLELLWAPRQFTPAEMADAEQRIRDRTFMIGKEQAERPAPQSTGVPPPQSTDEQKQDVVPGSPEANKDLKKTLEHHEAAENYLIRQLRRIP